MAAQYIRGKSVADVHADYEGFVEKFKPKKTTDDCYTPPEIYEAIANWVAKEYKMNRENFVRPFWPGGDYEHYDYKEDDVVVDNPPFSIEAKIVDFYLERSIPFFLFCPTLTAFRRLNRKGVTVYPCNITITYENMAKVNTSFVSNFEPGVIVKTLPELYKICTIENQKNERRHIKELPKYDYPDSVIHSAFVGRLCRYGIDYEVKAKDAKYILALDAQKECKKTIYGGGLLLSEKAAAEKAAAEKAAAEKARAIVWKLSDRELAIVQELNEQEAAETASF